MSGGGTIPLFYSSLFILYYVSLEAALSSCLALLVLMSIFLSKHGLLKKMKICFPALKQHYEHIPSVLQLPELLQCNFWLNLRFIIIMFITESHNVLWLRFLIKICFPWSSSVPCFFFSFSLYLSLIHLQTAGAIKFFSVFKISNSSYFFPWRCASLVSLGFLFLDVFFISAFFMIIQGECINNTYFFFLFLTYLISKNTGLVF